MQATREILQHLHDDYREPVRDPLWKHVYMTRPLLRLLGAPGVQQLSRIKQLGPACLVYPGATHTRLNHSIGVFHVAKRMLEALVATEPEARLSLDGARAFLCACLLHDVGHYPYAHSLDGLDVKDHEVLTGEVVRSAPISTILRDDVGVDPDFVAAIVDRTLPASAGEEPSATVERSATAARSTLEEVNLYRNVLSGALDPDKLDYLNRDAYFCGVPYGVQDIDYALSMIRLNGMSGIRLLGEGVSAVENILFSKYLMYRAVYWHRTVRVATAMIKKALYLAMRDGVLSEGDLYGLDDGSLFAGLRADRFAPFNLVDLVFRRELHKTVVDVTFDPASHERLGSIEHRTDMEERIAAAIDGEVSRSVRPTDVIIDLPGAVSFEVDLPVTTPTGLVDYPQSTTVFSRDVVRGFMTTLRRVRLNVSADLVGRISDPRRFLEPDW